MSCRARPVAAVVPTGGGDRAASRRSTPATSRSAAGSGRAGSGRTASGRSPTASPQLERAGNLDEPPASPPASRGSYQALGMHVRAGLPVPRLRRLQVARGGRLGAGPGARSGARARWPTRRSTLVAAAQRPTATSTRSSRSWRGGAKYADLEWGHELYCFGHLIQAAVAWHRALGDDRLLDVARARRRLASSRALGPGRARRGSTAIPRSRWRSSSCTGSPASGATSSSRAPLIDRRGQGCSGRGRFGGATGRTTRRSATRPTVAGHAVRQLYLDCRRGRRRGRDRRRRAPRGGAASLARHGRDADVPDRRRSAAATRTRRSATRSSCRRTGRTPRPARRSPA